MRSDIPTIVVYSPARLRYAVLQQTITHASVGTFIDQVLAGKARTSVLQVCKSFVHPKS